MAPIDYPREHRWRHVPDAHLSDAVVARGETCPADELTVAFEDSCTARSRAFPRESPE